MGDEWPDEALMRQMACDDTSAFDAIFMRHRRTVLSYLFRLVGDVGAAEDLTQECFLRVWRARYHYQPTAAFRTWLFTIARRLALDLLKRRHVPVMPLAADAERDHEVPLSPEVAARLASSDPQEVVLARELERRLEAALRQLPDDLREVVTLRDVEALSYEEMAMVIGCPIGTVKSRLNAARSRLRTVAVAWLGSP